MFTRVRQTQEPTRAAPADGREAVSPRNGTGRADPAAMFAPGAGPLVTLQATAGNAAVGVLLGRQTLQRKPGDKDTAALVAKVIKAIIDPEKPTRDRDAVLYSGFRFTTDAAQVQQELTRAYATLNPFDRPRADMIDGFVEGLLERMTPDRLVDTRTNQADGPPTDQLIADVKTALDRGRREVRSWAGQYRTQFTIDAVHKADEVLDKSKQVVESERDRYGLKATPKKTFLGITYGGGERSMDQGADSRALLQSLGDLRGKFAIYAAFAGLSPGGLARPNTEDPNVQNAIVQYNGARGIAERRFPILASFQLDLNRGAELDGTFRQLADNPAELFGEQVDSKLANISTSRQALWEDGNRIWLLPNVVALTRADKQIGAGTAEDARIKECATEAEVHKENVDLIKGAVAIGVGLIASPLGPQAAALAGAAAGALLALDNLQEAMLQDALSGTSFQKAQALSLQAPDWLWVAADLLLSVIDLGAAAKEFAAFVKLREEIRLAKGAGAVARDERALSQARDSLVERGNKYGRNLGNRMAEDAVNSAPTPEQLARAAMEQQAGKDVTARLADLRGGKLARPQAISALDQGLEFLPPPTVLQESGGWRQLVGAVGEDAPGLVKLDAYRGSISREAEAALREAKNLTPEQARQTLESSLAAKSGLAADHITDLLGLEIQALTTLLDSGDSGFVVAGGGVSDDLSKATAEDAGESPPAVQQVVQRVGPAERALAGHTGSSFEMIGADGLAQGAFVSYGVPRMDIVIPGQYNPSGWGVDRIGISVDGPRIRVYQVEFKYVAPGSGHIPELGVTAHGLQTGREWTENAAKALLESNHPAAVGALKELRSALTRAGLSADEAMVKRVLLRRLPKAEVFVITPFYAPLQILGAQIRALAREGRSMLLVPAKPVFGPRGGRIRW